MIWVWIWKICPKNIKLFNFLSFGSKKSLLVGSEAARNLLLRVKSKLGSGRGPSLLNRVKGWINNWNINYNWLSFSWFISNLLDKSIWMLLNYKNYQQRALIDCQLMVGWGTLILKYWTLKQFTTLLSSMSYSHVNYPWG